METRTTNSTELKQEQIAARAYQIWEASGRRSGSDLENWLQAESELAGGKTANTSVSPAKSMQKSAAYSAPQANAARTQPALGPTPKRESRQPLARA